MPWPACFLSNYDQNVQTYHPITSLSQFHFLYHLIFTLFISSQRYLQRRPLLKVLLHIVHKLEILLSLPSVDGEGIPAQVKATYFLLPGLRDFSHVSSLLPDLQNCSYLSQCKYDKGFSIQSEKALISVLTWPPSIVIIQSSAIRGGGVLSVLCCPSSSRGLIYWDQTSVTSISCQLLFVKSTVTFLMHYLMNYFLSLPKLLLEFWNLKCSFALALVIHPLLFCFLSHPSGHSFYSLRASVFFLSIFKSKFPITSLRACAILSPFLCFTQTWPCRVINSPDPLAKLQTDLPFRRVFLSYSVVYTKSKSTCLICIYRSLVMFLF